MFGTNENKESMLLYFGASNTNELEFYQKIQRNNKDYRLFDPNDLIPRTLAMAEIWVEDYMKDYATVALTGEGFGGFIANIIAHELNLSALLFNPILVVDGFDFPLNNSNPVEVFWEKDKFAIETSALPSHWNLNELSLNDKFNQEIVDWAVVNVCNDGWADIDDSVWFGED